ncbi:MAG: FimB/Mfa2 family fimbrial subunit [Alistipes sp.]|nr:FimB/Mfa2 family fimbrial subunit [Alistipes sp.]
MNRVHIFRRIALASAMVVAMLATSSCNDGLNIFDGQGDCGVYISFKYDYNIKFANAFANEVNSVALYVFDENGVLVEYTTATDKEELSKEKFEIPLELAPGKYNLLAWGGLMNEESFDLLAEAKVGETKIEEVQVKMHRKYNDNGEAVVDEDLLPLYHGSMPIEVSDEDGTYRHTMSLKKNTNSVRILLHEMSGQQMDADQYIFEIKDNNGLYDWDNTLLADEDITYSAWYQETGSADVEESRAITSISVALAELTIGRMRADKSPMLYIKNRLTGEMVASLPLAEYALLVKGYHNESMGNQEYLDRQDEYTLTFFLDEGVWLDAYILINSWRVVINNAELN